MGQRVNLYSKLKFNYKCRQSENKNEKKFFKLYELDPKPDELAMNRLKCNNRGPNPFLLQ